MKRVSAILNLNLNLNLILTLILSLVLLFSFSGNLWADEWQELFPVTKPPALYGHTMVEIDGKIYLYGGYSSASSSSLSELEGMDELLSVPPIPLPEVYNDLWKYDPINRDWTRLDPPTPPPKRQRHSAAVSNGKMYVFFGLDAANTLLGDIWSYDPATNSWGQEPSGGTQPSPRFNHSSEALPDGRIGVYGGVYPNPQSDKKIWIYTPGAGTWESRDGPPTSAGYDGHTASVINGKLYFFGGWGQEGISNEVLVYDFVANSWVNVTPQGNGPSPRAYQGGAQWGSSFWIFGGESVTAGGSGGVSINELKDAWEFNTSTNSWKKRTDLPIPLSEVKAVAVSSGAAGLGFDGEESSDSSPSILLFGGVSGGVAVNRMFAYSPEEGPPPVTEYTLTVIKTGTGSGTVTGSGINCGSDCSETYSKVQNVKLTAKADANSTFTGWSGGGCSGTGTCQVTVDEETTVTAGFSLKVPDISVAQTSLDFGTAKTGKSVKKKLAIKNNGAGDLSISLEGLSGTEFSFSGNSSVTIKAKKTYNLNLTFKPTSAGQKTATLRINSNDLDTPTIDIQLSGTRE